jgi:hypothetical protein
MMLALLIGHLQEQPGAVREIGAQHLGETPVGVNGLALVADRERHDLRVRQLLQAAGLPAVTPAAAHHHVDRRAGCRTARGAGGLN